MYAPKRFREERKDVFLEAIGLIQFAGLATYHGNRFIATHIPMLVTENNDNIILEGHVARANEMNDYAASQAAAIAIFQGPQAYISPEWYATKKTHGRVVPTWNYIVVHCHGHMELCESKDWLKQHFERMTDTNEATREQPWSISDAPEDYIRQLINSIVGFKLYVEKMEGFGRCCSIILNKTAWGLLMGSLQHHVHLIMKLRK